LGDIAVTGCRAAHVGALRVRRAARARPVAELVDVADARRRAAERARVPGIVLTGVVHAVAEIGRADVPVVRARRPAPDLVLPRTGGARPRAALGHVALARGPAADRRRRLEGIGGTCVRRAVAALGDVTDACRGAAYRARRLL